MIYTLNWFDTEDFVEFSKQVNQLKENEKLTIFIDSLGWSIIVRDMYLNVINSLQNVELVGCVLYSAAFTLFEQATCKKTLLPSTYAMVHHEAWIVDLWFEWVPRGRFEKFKFEYKMKCKPPEMKWMTKKERKAFDKGYEVFLDRDRLREIFNF